MTISEHSTLFDQAHTSTTKALPGGIGFDWAFLIPCTWLMSGISLDGWAHNHIPSLETFFTPWHGVLYSGYLAVAVFLLATLLRNHQRGFAWLQAIPPGYGPSLLGAGIFAVGGVLDLIWHTLFGIEKSTEALLSPTHLMLALGAVLMVSGPFRAAWQRPPTDPASDRRNLFPMLFSLAYVLAIFTFFTQFANPIANSLADQHTGDGLISLGIASILLQTALYMGCVLFVMRRWWLPLGAFTLLYIISSIVSSLMAKDSQVLAVAIFASLTGLLIDLLYRGLKPVAERTGAIRLFAFLTPVVINGMYFLGLASIKGLAWSVHLWAGSIVMSGIVGLLLSYVLVPPQQPTIQGEPPMSDVSDRLFPASQTDLSQLAPSKLTSLTPVPRVLLLWLTLGLAGAVLFTTTYLIEGVTRPGYNAWQQAISALSLGPGGWIQQANFVVFGVCVLCMAVAWRKILKDGVVAIVYPIIRGIEGLGLILVGFFSQDPTSGYPPGALLTPPTIHGEIHIIGAFVIVGAMALGLFVIAWHFARNLHWWGWAVYSVISGILTLFFMALFGMAQNSGYAGLFERLATNSETVWEILLLALLWTGAKFIRPTRRVSPQLSSSL